MNPWLSIVVKPIIEILVACFAVVAVSLGLLLGAAVKTIKWLRTL
jgi:hypothetical protein